MSQLVLHPATEASMLSLQKHGLPQALLLSGEHGVGLLTIARSLAGEALHDVLEPAITGKTTTRVHSIDTIRNLYQRLTTKSTKRRVVIIDDAELMTTPAQNAFLKLLEEPPVNTHFVITSHQEASLLPTVRSRLQTIRIPLVSELASRRYISSLDPSSGDARNQQLLFIASGRPAELHRLIADQPYFDEQSQRFRLARDFLAATTYQKITQLAQTNSRDNALDLLDTSLTILKRSMTDRPNQSLVHEMQRLLAAKEAIRRGGNVRLQLLRAVV